jgi:hypothetical protein
MRRRQGWSSQKIKTGNKIRCTNSKKGKVKKENNRKEAHAPYSCGR